MVRTENKPKFDHGAPYLALWQRGPSVQLPPEGGSYASPWHRGTYLALLEPLAPCVQFPVPEFHAEPYVYLAGLSHKSALIAWGAFYFKARSDGRAKLVDDEDLQWVHPPRCESIGCRSAPYGPARVEVRDDAGALVAEALDRTRATTARCLGFEPNTRYTYSSP